MEPRVRPREHARGLLRIEARQPHEQPEHGAAECLGQAGRVMGRPRDERPVGAEATVGDEQMQVRMPVGALTRQRAVRLQTRDDADRQVALTRQRADGCRDRAGGDAGDLAEQAATIQAIGAEPLANPMTGTIARNRPMPTRGRVGPDRAGTRTLRPPTGLRSRRSSVRIGARHRSWGGLGASTFSR